MLIFKKKVVKNLCLLGLMGSGKSIIGKDLSRVYKYKFIDTDNEIEKFIGMNIETIFSKYGENYFRKIEERICLKVLDYNDCIISFGGGSILNAIVRKKINKESLSIYLKVDQNILVKRLSKSTKRPLLKNTDTEVVINQLYKKRKNYYNKADLIIENNGQKKIVLENILKKIKKYD